MNGFRYVVGVAVLLAVTCAHAEGSKAKLAQDFVKLVGYDKQYDDYHKSCINTYQGVSPESLVSKQPNYFYGIKPGDDKWPLVVSAYKEYFENACAHPTRKEFVGVLVRSYEVNLSEEDLQRAIAFYSSPLGQRLSDAGQLAAKNSYASWVEVNKKYVTEAVLKFQKRLSDIVQ
ncbi:hypothetical protein DBR44_16390 [Aquitalea sp. FJL05]|nr:hypothetical protein DBR44_16390 [Aquitalea sp. FJL05]